MRKAARAVAITGMILIPYTVMGGAFFGSPFCLKLLDWGGHHIWLLLIPGLLRCIWRRWHLPYAERVREISYAERVRQES